MTSTTPLGTDGYPAGWRRPVFIGGTGRSGTWALGRLLGTAPGWRTIRTELRFHADPRGIAGYLRGEVPEAKLLHDLAERWYRRTGGGGRPKGLQILAEEAAYLTAVEAFGARLADGQAPAEAVADLLLDVLAPHLTDGGVQRWAETTPNNVAAAGALAAAFPAARFVHAVRDGRDVAASVASMTWGPDTLDEALTWWEKRLRRADAGYTACPHDARVVVRLEELVLLDRDAQLARLAAFLEATDDEGAAWEQYFTHNMTKDALHVARWRGQLDRRAARRFDRAYRRAYRRLERDGVTSLPLDPDTVDTLASS